MLLSEVLWLKDTANTPIAKDESAENEVEGTEREKDCEMTLEKGRISPEHKERDGEGENTAKDDDLRHRDTERTNERNSAVDEDERAGEERERDKEERDGGKDPLHSSREVNNGLDIIGGRRERARRPVYGRIRTNGEERREREVTDRRERDRERGRG